MKSRTKIEMPIGFLVSPFIILSIAPKLTRKKKKDIMYNSTALTLDPAVRRLFWGTGAGAGFLR
ncbi:hypothetical protein ACE38W_15105 [Chitinophaga sp. Hz27]|uniref:hypothetical protein n=1 Tax=Chitinophaga sp. Hz27 TaxID=3347169 RepID=UPI0035E2AD4A